MSRDIKVSPVVIDLGNFNVKYLGEYGSDSFVSKFKLSHGSWMDKYERIFFNGSEYFMGVGKFNKEPNKVKKQYMPNLLLAITKALGLDDNTEYNYESGDEHPVLVDMCLLLPISQMSDREEYASALKGKTFEYKYNDKKRMISIASLTVVPEGFASYLSLNEEQQKGLVAIFDIGSRTINWTLIFSGKIQDSGTIEDMGAFRYYDILKGVCEKDGCKYTDDKISMLIESKKITPEQVEVAKDSYFEELISDINDVVNISENTLTVFTGGTANEMKERLELEYEDENILVCENYLTSNIDGCGKMLGIVQ